MKVPFLSFQAMNERIKPEIIQSFGEFFDKSWYILGDNVRAFEADYAAFNEVPHAIGVSNGLDALHIALKTLNIGTGDEVIVPFQHLYCHSACRLLCRCNTHFCGAGYSHL